MKEPILLKKILKFTILKIHDSNEHFKKWIYFRLLTEGHEDHRAKEGEPDHGGSQPPHNHDVDQAEDHRLKQTQQDQVPRTGQVLQQHFSNLTKINNVIYPLHVQTKNKRAKDSKWKQEWI